MPMRSPRNGDTYIYKRGACACASASRQPQAISRWTHLRHRGPRARRERSDDTVPYGSRIRAHHPPRSANARPVPVRVASLETMPRSPSDENAGERVRHLPPSLRCGHAALLPNPRARCKSQLEDLCHGLQTRGAWALLARSPGRGETGPVALALQAGEDRNPRRGGVPRRTCWMDGGSDNDTRSPEC
ncbi:hypothetical protein C8Q80DRAFT_1208837 [Daedaleopsis nitida]|nr:hypothetical protein C8Q80DRAFT_1208837 [Daedaleopsis nitida]